MVRLARSWPFKKAEGLPLKSDLVTVKNNKLIYALVGLVLGIGAPVAWTIIRLLFFADPAAPLSTQVFSDFAKSSYNAALYSYMGIGTAVVMGVLGYFIGKASDELTLRACELDTLHREVATQKELFENRYRVLDNNIKNFHQISSKIQKSVNLDEVLFLCAEGLHDVLGYERVNIFMVDRDRSSLTFVTATGSDDFDIKGVSIPLDQRSGVLFKCFQDKRIYLVDDITTMPEDFQMRPPCSEIVPLRSSSFIVCPIVVKGETVGIFGIDNKFSHRRLNDTDVDTIKLFADQAASAINKINLLRAIDTLTRELDRSFSEILKTQPECIRYIFNMKGAVDSVNENSAHIATATEGVMRSVEETSTATGEISQAIEQVTRNLDGLTETSYKAAAAMEEINASLKNVEQNAAVSYQISRTVKERADEGKGVVQETVGALADIQHAVDLSYSGIKRLSENSVRIESIVNVINDITKRTNLLALNASIIAAQAGEYGKSFGVVADEIRNLSLQTGQSTGEITGIIDEIMTESKNAASNITLTKELVQKGVNQGSETGAALQAIIDSASEAMEMTEEIKIATEEQATSVQLVTQSMEDVSSMTSQLFNVSKEQANSARNIALAVENIKMMVQGMVAATSRQVEGGNESKLTVDAVGNVVENIFANLEKRRDEGATVVKELEMIRKTTA